MTIIRFRNSRPMFSGMLENMLENDFSKTFEKNNEKLPATNIRENEEAYLIEVAAPGRSKEDFNLQMENMVLKITFQTPQQETQKEDQYLLKEFDAQSFSRSFVIPKKADPENISASYQHGILSISVPKLKTEKAPLPRSIEIA